MSAFTLTVDVPPALWMTSNSRLHWAEKARRTRMLRRLAAVQARAQNAVKYAGKHAGRVRVTVTVQPRTRGRFDPANAYPTVKALIDGCTDAGVWADDDHTHLAGPDMRAGAPDPAQPTGWHRLTITITEEDQS